MPSGPLTQKWGTEFSSAPPPTSGEGCRQCMSATRTSSLCSRHHSFNYRADYRARRIASECPGDEGPDATWSGRGIPNLVQRVLERAGEAGGGEQQDGDTDKPQSILLAAPCQRRSASVIWHRSLTARSRRSVLSSFQPRQCGQGRATRCE